jgi:hypothetical protein
MSKIHRSYVEVPRRRVTPQEEAWIHEIILANPVWSDAEIRDLLVAAECNCGCHSVVLGKPLLTQNHKLIGHQGLVGEIELTVKVGSQNEVISVLLRFADGSLSLLEVVWYNFREPIPASWIEIGRRICNSN